MILGCLGLIFMASCNRMQLRCVCTIYKIFMGFCKVLENYFFSVSSQNKNILKMYKQRTIKLCYTLMLNDYLWTGREGSFL